MADIKIKYGSDAAFTVTNLQSLATSASKTSGWTSAAVDNTSILALDYLVGGEFKVGASPTTAKTIGVYAYACYRDNGGSPVWPDLFSSGTEGSEGTAAIHDEEQRNCGLVLLWECTIDNGASEVYSMPPKSIAAAFGGSMPQRFAIFVSHDTGQNLASSGNAIYSVPVLSQTV